MKKCESKHTINKKNGFMFLWSFVAITRVLSTSESCEKSFKYRRKCSDVLGISSVMFEKCPEASEVTRTETEKNRVENLTHLSQEKLVGINV